MGLATSTLEGPFSAVSMTTSAADSQPSYVIFSFSEENRGRKVGSLRKDPYPPHRVENFQIDSSGWFWERAAGEVICADSPPPPRRVSSGDCAWLSWIYLRVRPAFHLTI